MSTPNRPARLNRTLLGLLGLILGLAGIFGLLLGLGALRGVLPRLDPSARLVPTEIVTAPWVPYLSSAVAVIVGLLCLRWLLAQALRRPKTTTWRLPVEPGRGSTRLDTDAAADAVAADIAAYPGVAKTIATLTGARPQPELHLIVSTETGTPIGPLRERITTHALPRLCRALELDTVRTDLILRLDTTDDRARAR
ncbi:MAG: alkaline shock response membrane anchor protein AmaP [Actinomycetota bacterium]|nr:alkaline shock response membrane anchor protein AmaP [Actinomycetota bacterium]